LKYKRNKRCQKRYPIPAMARCMGKANQALLVGVKEEPTRKVGLKKLEGL